MVLSSHDHGEATMLARRRGAPGTCPGEHGTRELGRPGGPGKGGGGVEGGKEGGKTHAFDMADEKRILEKLAGQIDACCPERSN